MINSVNKYIAKVTTVTDHGLIAGNTVSISGAIPSVYNVSGAIVLSGPTARYFEYEINSDPLSPAQGNISLIVPISQGNRIIPYGEIVDYSNTITPIVGIGKPKNFSLIRRGIGFNQDTDRIVSKGRNSSGNAIYNSVFKLEYFNPVFFTKITLESKIVSGFSAGQYITGSQSGAYAVIEGSPDSSFSSSNTLSSNTSSPIITSIYAGSFTNYNDNNKNDNKNDNNK